MAKRGCRWRAAVNEAMTTKLVALFLLFVALFVAIGWFGTRRGSGQIPVISYSHFLRDLEADQVDRILIQGRAASGQTKDGKSFRVQLPYLDAQLADDIALHSDATFEDAEPAWPGNLLLSAGPILVLLFLWL